MPPISRIRMFLVGSRCVGLAVLGMFLIVGCNLAFAQEPIETFPVPSGSSAGAQSLETGLAKAQTLLEQGDPQGAEAFLRQYLLQNPKSADAHYLLGRTLFLKIQKLAATSALSDQIKADSARDSLAEYTEGAKYRRPDPADLRIVAFDYIVLADFSDADRWLTRMLDEFPSDADGWYYLGRTKYNENRFAEAIRAFSRSLALDPQNARTEDNLGLAYAGLGKVEEAFAAYQAAIEWQKTSARKDAGPYTDIASLLLDQDRTSEAIPYLLQAVAIAPYSSKPHELLGKAYARQEHYEAASLELEKATQFAPNSPNLPCMLVTVYRKLAQLGKAQKAMDRCAALNENHNSTR